MSVSVTIKKKTLSPFTTCRVSLESASPPGAKDAPLWLGRNLGIRRTGYERNCKSRFRSRCFSLPPCSVIMAAVSVSSILAREGSFRIKTFRFSRVRRPASFNSRLFPRLLALRYSSVASPNIARVSACPSWPHYRSFSGCWLPTSSVTFRFDSTETSSVTF